MAETENIKNEGDLAEAVLGAAIIAKLINRKSGGVIGKVGAADVRKILQLMQRSPVQRKGGNSQSIERTQVKVDVGGLAKDRISFLLTMKVQVISELGSLRNLSSLDRIAQAAASYVNAPRTEGLAESVFRNNTSNKILVNVDGLSANKATKVDVSVDVDGNAWDKISLKAGKKATGKSLGQVGGPTWCAILRVFGDGFNEKTKREEGGLQLPIANPANEKRYMDLLTETPTFSSLSSGVSFAYKVADDLFNTVPASMQAKVVNEFLQFHSTLKDPSVRIVEFHLEKHKVYNPLILEHNLKDIKMKAVTRLEGKWPLFIVYDSTSSLAPPTTQYSPNVLFAIRPKADTRSLYITHLIEKGTRMNELMDVTGKE